MTKKISFYPVLEEMDGVLEHPVVAMKSLPQWYKNMPSTIENHRLPRTTDNRVNKTAKKCMPLFDSIGAGYLMTLDGDVVFNPPAAGFQYQSNWSTSHDLVGVHFPEQIEGMPIPEGFSSQPLKWFNYWSIKTPPGYSCLFVHPIGRSDLPFFTMSAIVAIDKYSPAINFPFLIKEGFYGKIPKGTPIAQVIPIKREGWKHSIEKFNESIFRDSKIMLKYLEKAYFKNYWSKKNYK